jgi:hypothetical protein
MPKDIKSIASCKIIINDGITTKYKTTYLWIRHNPKNIKTKAKEWTAKRLWWKNQ